MLTSIWTFVGIQSELGLCIRFKWAPTTIRLVERSGKQRVWGKSVRMLARQPTFSSVGVQSSATARSTVLYFKASRRLSLLPTSAPKAHKSDALMAPGLAGSNSCLVNRRAWVQIPAVGFCTRVKLHLQTSEHSDIDALGTRALSQGCLRMWPFWMTWFKTLEKDALRQPGDKRTKPQRN